MKIAPLMTTPMRFGRKPTAAERHLALEKAPQEWGDVSQTPMLVLDKNGSEAEIQLEAHKLVFDNPWRALKHYAGFDSGGFLLLVKDLKDAQAFVWKQLGSYKGFAPIDFHRSSGTEVVMRLSLDEYPDWRSINPYPAPEKPTRYGDEW